MPEMCVFIIEEPTLSSRHSQGSQNKIESKAHGILIIITPPSFRRRGEEGSRKYQKEEKMLHVAGVHI